MNEAQAMLDAVTNQRNSALNECVMLTAKLAAATAEVAELKAAAAVNKPAPKKAKET